MTDTEIVTTIRREFTADAAERALLSKFTDKHLAWLYHYWIDRKKDTTFKALLQSVEDDWLARV